MKDTLAVLSVACMALSYVPYLHALKRKKAKPHGFSWLLWGFISGVACAAQVSEGAGGGAWVAGFVTVVNTALGLYALKYGEKKITRGDWIVFIAALLAIPLWAVTKNPLWSVVLVSVIDVAAFYPTVRKSWQRPYEEVAGTFVLGGFAYGFSLLALETWSFVNYCYPATVLAVNAVFVSVLLLRRRQVAA